MANTDNINELFDVPAIEKQKNDVIKAMDEVLAKMKEVANSLIGMGQSFQNGQGGGKNPGALLGEQAKLAQELIKLKNQLTAAEAKLALATSDEAKELARLNAALAEQNRLNKEAATGNNAAAAARKAEAQAKRDQARADKEALLQAKEEAKINAELGSAYKLLSKAYEDAKRKYQDYAAELGLGSKITIEAQKNVKVLYDQLLAIDQGAGDFRRNVGNYASAFNGIGVATQQVLRELPSLAVSMNTFFLAVSNNLPTLFDEISKINKANKEAKAAALENAAAAKTQAVETALLGGESQETANALGEQAYQTALAATEGKKGVSAFKALFQSLFSFQSLLTVGITLLTVYGKDIIDFANSLIFGSRSADRATLSLNAFNESMKDKSVATAYENLYRLRIEVDLAKKGFADKNEVVKDFNETLGKTIGQEQTLLGVEKSLIENAEDFITFTLLKAQATAALNLAAEEAIKVQIKQREAGEDIGKAAPGSAMSAFYSISALVKDQQAESARETSKTLQDIAKDYYDQLAKLVKEKNFNLFDPGKDSKKKAQDLTNELLSAREKELEEQKRIDEAIYSENQKNIENIYNDETRSLDDRAAALAEYQANKLQVVKIETDAEIAAVQSRLDKIAEIEAKAAKDRTNEEKVLLINKKANLLELERIQVESQKKINDINAEGDAKNTKIIQSESKKQYDAVIKSLNDIAEAGKKSGLNDVQIWENQKKYLQDSLAELGLNAAETEKILEKVTDLNIKQQEAITKINKDSVKAREQAEKQLYDVLVKGAEELVQSIAQIFSASLIRRQEELQGENAYIDKQKQKEIDDIETSTLAEEEKQKRIIIAEQEATAKKEENERKIADLKVRQANLDKIINAAQAGGNTLASIMDLKGRLAEATARAAVLYAQTLTPITGPLFVPAAAAMTSAAGLISGSIIATAAAGALQVGQILAAPIAKYAGGKDSSDPYTGDALMGEAGPELLITKDKRMFFADKPTFFHTRAGDTVLSNEQLKQGAALPYLIGSDDSRSQEELKDKLDEVIWTLKRQKSPVVNIYSESRFTKRINNGYTS